MLLTGGAILVAGAGIVGVALFGDDDPTGADAEAASADEPATLVEVVQRDLARTEELDGTVAYGTATPLVLAVEGTLTGLPDVGDVIGAGDVIAEVDGQPVVALNGPTPLWRTLGPGVDDGTDVLTVEYVLAAMGYAEEHDMTVDEEWTSATTEAVEDFQADHGQDDDGQIDLGEVVFVDGAVRIDAVAGALGQRASEAGIEVTSPERAVARRPAGRRRRPDGRRRRRRRRAGDRRSAPGDRRHDRLRRNRRGWFVDAPGDPHGRGRRRAGRPFAGHRPRRDRSRRRCAGRPGRGAARPGRGWLRRRACGRRDDRAVAVELGVFADGMVEVTRRSLPPATRWCVP